MIYKNFETKTGKKAHMECIHFLSSWRKCLFGDVNAICVSNNPDYQQTITLDWVYIKSVYYYQSAYRECL